MPSAPWAKQMRAKLNLLTKTQLHQFNMDSLSSVYHGHKPSCLLVFVCPAHGTMSVTVPNPFLLLVSVLLALDCTELMLHAGWSAPGQFFSVYWLWKVHSSSSPDAIWSSWTQFFPSFHESTLLWTKHSHCLPRCCPGAWLQLGALGNCPDVLLQ